MEQCAPGPLSRPFFMLQANYWTSIKGASMRRGRFWRQAAFTQAFVISHLPFQKAVAFLAAAPHFLPSPTIFVTGTYSYITGMLTISYPIRSRLYLPLMCPSWPHGYQHAQPPILGLGGIPRNLTLPDAKASLHWQLNQRESITLKD